MLGFLTDFILTDFIDLISLNLRLTMRLCVRVVLLGLVISVEGFGSIGPSSRRWAPRPVAGGLTCGARRHAHFNGRQHVSASAAMPASTGLPALLLELGGMPATALSVAELCDLDATLGEGEGEGPGAGAGEGEGGLELTLKRWAVSMRRRNILEHMLAKDRVSSPVPTRARTDVANQRHHRHRR